ncbi:transposase family protein [Pseudonocardia sp. H11422]|uniref:transposase family protein n=1 Tax=Pseudonocardia sp. H11422 TaxID=2835866 RepID=UPI001BDCCDEE|nr:transposase family protein [Pseudonocardia sp. H11422]
MTVDLRAGAVVLSLVEALSTVPDPRSPRGVRHGVLAALLIGACAVLAGARSFVAVAEYAHDAGQAVLEMLGVGVVVPHESMIRRVLQQVDAPALEAALQVWALAQLDAQIPDAGTPAREQRRVWALDGKTVRGEGGRQGDVPARRPGRRAPQPAHERDGGPVA